jgi:PhnB protein
MRQYSVRPHETYRANRGVPSETVTRLLIMSPVTTVISLMLAVEDASASAEWYASALGARQLWSLGSVIGLDIGGAKYFLHEATDNGFTSPTTIGQTTVRVEIFVDNPDEFVARAVAAGARATSDGVERRTTPWGTHRQGGFIDPSATPGW